MFRRRRIAVVALSVILSFISFSVAAAEKDDGWTSLFNGTDPWGWTAMNEAKCEVRDGLLCLVGGMGWLRSDQLYDDFVLEWESRALKDESDSGIFFRAGLEGTPWPDKGYQVNLRHNQEGALIVGTKPIVKSKPPVRPTGEWAKWVLTVQGNKGSLEMNGKKLWETDQLEPGRGLIGIQAEEFPFEFRNIRIREIGYANLLTGDGPTGSHFTTLVGAKEAWSLKNGVLACKGGGGGWIGTKRDDYANFDLKLEFNVPKDGNSGVFIRRPLQGDGAYTGMEIQVIDDDATVFGKLQPWQLCGSIYHEVAPSVRATRKSGTWQTMEIVADKNIVQIYINGIRIANADLDKYTTSTTKAAPLKDRPRKGHIGLQNHGSGIEYRNVRVKELGE